MIEKEFVPYELAVKLKAIGFDEPCLACYIDEEDKDILSFSFDSNDCYQEIEDNELKRNTQFKNSITAPTFSQAFRWFREKYPDLDFGVGKIHNGTNNYHYHINLTWDFFEGTYEAAELACLTKLIEIVEFKKEVR